MGVGGETLHIRLASPLHARKTEKVAKLSLIKFSAAHSLAQVGTVIPCRGKQNYSSTLQTTEQKTADLKMRKQVGFLLPNKALSVGSFLHWIKLGTEIRK